MGGHTKGPWKAHEGLIYGQSLHCDLIASIHSGCDCNKTTADMASAISFETSHCNTDLIKAAPDMYETLRKIAYAPIGKADATHGEMLEEITKMAIRAIDRAEGKE